MNQSNNEQLAFEIYQEFVECYTQINDISKAIEHFDHASQILPESERPFIGLGVAVLQQNRVDEAKRYFKKAVTLNSNSDKAAAGFAMALFNNGEINEALIRYRVAMDINPTNMTALLGLVQCAYTLNMLDTAVEYLHKYLEHYPANANILYCLAGTYYKQLKIRECREIIDRILLFKPQHEEALALLQKLEEGPENGTYEQCQNA